MPHPHADHRQHCLQLTAQQFEGTNGIGHDVHSTAFIEVTAPFHAHYRHTGKMAQDQFTRVAIGACG